MAYKDPSGNSIDRDGGVIGPYDTVGRGGGGKNGAGNGGDRAQSNLQIAGAGKVGKEVLEAVVQRELRAAINYARQRAVQDAWKMERQTIINNFPGTRNWTLSQRKELIETGRISGFDGHHINTVNGNLDLAANHRNIEFLTKTEHYDLHRQNGGTHNPISGRALIDRTYGGQLQDLATPAARSWGQTLKDFGVLQVAPAVIFGLEVLDQVDPIFGPNGILGSSPAH